jgi:hypothetical protein
MGLLYLYFSRNCAIDVTLGRVRITIVAVEKQCLLPILCVRACVRVTLVIQHALRMRRMILSSHKRHQFKGH